MSKITLNDVTNIDSLATINSNFDKIESELQNKVLYRENPVGEPNTMNQSIDMNGYDIINVGSVSSSDGQWATVNELIDIQEDVTAKAVQVNIDKMSTDSYRTDTELLYQFTSDAIVEFEKKYLGVKPADPLTDNYGNALIQGSLYFRTTAPKIMRVYNGTAWQDVGSITVSTTNTIDSALYASYLEAITATNATKVMTPQRVKDAIDYFVLTGNIWSGDIILPGNVTDPFAAVPLQQVQELAEARATEVVNAAVDELEAATQIGQFKRVERFTSNGSFVKQPGDRLIEVKVIGPGASGGSYPSGVQYGGGSGATAWKTYLASELSASEPVVIGTSAPFGDPAYAPITSFKGVEAYSPNGPEGGIASGADHWVKGGSGEASTSSTNLSGGNSSLGGAGSGYVSASGTQNAAPNSGSGGGRSGAGGSGYVEIRVYS